MTKTKQQALDLEIKSTIAELDLNGDGVITDAELDRNERIIQLDNLDKLQDQQRYMAWAALVLPVVLMLVMMLPVVSVEKVDAVMGVATTFVAAMGTIITVFIGGTAYVKGKMNNKEQK